MRKLSLLFLILFFSLHNAVLAQNPGDLDNSFGWGGATTVTGAPLRDVTIQTDGKLLAVGNAIVRFHTNGALDNSFGVNGIDTIKIADTVYYCNAISLQQDGKILVAGGDPFFNPDMKDFLLIRYNTDGTLDSTFDGDGVVHTDLNSGSEDYGYELVTQPDGKIIVVGASDGRLALSRYHTDGSLDNTFDNDGKLVVNSVGSGCYIKLQNDGKILTGCGVNLARLNSDGSLDNSFGSNGVVVFTTVGINDLAIQPDGKIVLGGSSTGNFGTGFAIARLDTNGYLDNSFGNGGVRTTYWPGRDIAVASIALQTDGRILAGGSYWACALNNCRDFVLMRYNQNGSIDSSFGSDGKVTEVFFPNSCESHASVITPDFRIVLVGQSYDWDYGCLAKYHLGWLLNVNTLSSTNEDFIIAPNPTSDWINIEASTVENGIWHLEIRDITGRSLLREDIVATSGAIQKRVSLNGLPAGLYLLQLDNGKTKTVSKVVKSNN